MSPQPDADPEQAKAAQAMRAKRLRETIAAAKRGATGRVTPRSFTNDAAAEAGRKLKTNPGQGT